MNIEMEILAEIDHKNIIRILGGGETPRKFIIVEYLYGGTLDQMISLHKLGLPIQSALTIASELAAALKYLHNDVDPSLMVIHRGTTNFHSCIFIFI
jgi:serine/threonine protein kinase